MKKILFLILFFIMSLFIVGMSSADADGLNQEGINYIENGWILQDVNVSNDDSIVAKACITTFDSEDNTINIVKKSNYDSVKSTSDVDTSKMPVRYYKKIFNNESLDFDFKLEYTDYYDLGKIDYFIPRVFKDNSEYVMKVGYGTVTYDGVNNSIVCTDGTEGTPIDFDDINTAFPNLFTKIDDNSYNTSCKIYIGNTTDKCYFKDYDVNVIFNDGSMSGNGQSIINVYSDSVLILGNLINREKRITSQGCNIVSLETSFKYSKYILGGELKTNISVGIYGCTFNCFSNEPYDISKLDYIEAINCFVEGSFKELVNSFINSSTVYGFESNDIGLGYSTNTLFDDIKIINMDIPIYFYSTFDNHIYNTTILHDGIIDKLIRIYDIGVDCYLDNILIPYGFPTNIMEWEGINGDYRVYWRYSLTLDTDDTANVTVYDKNDNIMYNGIGDISYIMLNHSWYNTTNDDKAFYYTPYRLVISKNGMVTYNQSFNNSFKKMDYNIHLTSNEEIRIKEEIMISLGTELFVFVLWLVVVVMLYKTNRNYKFIPLGLGGAQLFIVAIAWYQSYFAAAIGIFLFLGFIFLLLGIYKTAKGIGIA